MKIVSKNILPGTDSSVSWFAWELPIPPNSFEKNPPCLGFSIVFTGETVSWASWNKKNSFLLKNMKQQRFSKLLLEITNWLKFT